MRHAVLLLASAALVFTACGASEFRVSHGKGDDAGVLMTIDAGTGGGGGALGGGTGGGSTGGGTGGSTGGGTGGGSTGGGTGGGGTSCGPSNCASGCCSGNTCVTSTSSAQCGSGGAACSACSGGDSCVSGACSFDLNATWHVLPSSAIVQDVWDLSSKPDVELGLWCPANAANVIIMPKVQDSTTPTWSSGGCDLTASELISGGIAFDAIDSDGAAYDQIVSYTQVPITQANLQSGSLTGSVGSDITITFTFTKQ